MTSKPIYEYIESGNNQKLKNAFTFRIQNINVSIANAFRRTILSNIQTVVLDTSLTGCFITENTGKLHNEIYPRKCEITFGLFRKRN
jgi:hypothetical protein